MREKLKQSFKAYLEDLERLGGEENLEVACCAHILLGWTSIVDDFVDKYVAEAFKKHQWDIDNPDEHLNMENIEKFWEISFFLPIINNWARNPIYGIDKLLETLSWTDVATSQLEF